MKNALDNENNEDASLTGITPQVKDNKLHKLAFDFSAHANIISTVSNGEIITANKAACKLLGYSKKELLAKNSSTFFFVKESSFKKMLKQKTDNGQSSAVIMVTKKSGEKLPCQITSAVFMEGGIQKSITTIVDMSDGILKQEKIDRQNKKIVEQDIVFAKSEQKIIDSKKDKAVANNIIIAKSKQKKIDSKKDKAVANNIIIAKTKQKKIDSKKDKAVADNIMLAKTKQKIIDSKKEKTVADNIVLAKTRQKEIDSKKDKKISQNIQVAKAISDDRQAANEEWIKLIAKTSYDIMWDWDITSGEIYVGESIEEIFGYKVKGNTVNFSDFSDCLLTGEKEFVEEKLRETIASGKESWNDNFQFKRSDGSVASTICRASIMRDSAQNAIRLIGAIQDVSKLQELENKLEGQMTPHAKDNQKFILSVKLSFDVIWDWNISTNEIFIGEGFEELFGYAIPGNKGNIGDWSTRLHPGDTETVRKGLHHAIASTAVNWQHAYRFARADGSFAKVFDRASIFRHADGQAYRMLGVMQDISRVKENKIGVPGSIVGKKNILVEKIKNVILEFVHVADEQLETNLSEYLGATLQYDYAYLTRLFTEVEGISIQKFIISQKIERAKKLMMDDELNLTEIAWKLHYSSVAHLSNQFKKVTGFTPSQYKQMKLS